MAAQARTATVCGVLARVPQFDELGALARARVDVCKPVHHRNEDPWHPGPRSDSRRSR
jgi:hypothetical protein